MRKVFRFSNVSLFGSPVPLAQFYHRCLGADGVTMADNRVNCFECQFHFIIRSGTPLWLPEIRVQGILTVPHRLRRLA